MFGAGIGKYLAIGGVVIGLAAVGGAYLKGRSDENLFAQAEARRQTIEQLTERNQVNENVSRMSAADLCRQLGGVFIDGECQ